MGSAETLFNNAEHRIQITTCECAFHIQVIIKCGTRDNMRKNGNRIVLFSVENIRNDSFIFKAQSLPFFRGTMRNFHVDDLSVGRNSEICMEYAELKQV